MEMQLDNVARHLSHRAKRDYWGECSGYIHPGAVGTGTSALIVQDENYKTLSQAIDQDLRYKHN